MKYQVILNNGQMITFDNGEFSPEVFTNSLNEPHINFVNIGGYIVNKHLIQSISPVTE